MAVNYVSTRDRNNVKTASEAILQGLAEDGGLFVPDNIPSLPASIKELGDMSYQEVAFLILKEFLSDYTEQEIRDCVDSAYDEKFDDPSIAPLSFCDGAYYIELYHGKTMAFKDMALSILPYLMTTAARKNNKKEDIVILTATSGDTGKAALAGFSDVEGTRICVFYPEKGVSPIQKHQMVTEAGKNTCVIGIRGNFDQAQTGVKKMFNDPDMKEKLLKSGYSFSSANSINIGRLVPQIVYYVNTYAKLVANEKIKEGEKINFVVPTGNFGNILAAFYAKEMGIPVNKLITASNENRVLYDFMRTGTYDKNREFHVTNSPSMDILISSNLERLIYRLTGNSDEKTRQLMTKLTEGGVYSITTEMMKEMDCFYGNFASEYDTIDKIKSVFDKTGYLIDTHTAVAAAVYDKYKKETGDKTVTAIASTASPFKFVKTVSEALHGKKLAGYQNTAEADLELCKTLSEETATPEPAPIEDLRQADVHHDIVCDVDQMPDEVLKFLNIM